MTRSLRDIDEAIADAIKVSCGTRPDKPCEIVIVAQDEEERATIIARLKGKHHAKGVSVALQHELVAIHAAAVDRSEG
jgi:hypothetical protein